MFVHLNKLQANYESDSLNIKIEPDTFRAPRSLVVESWKIDTAFTNRAFRENMLQKNTCQYLRYALLHERQLSEL
ncbi:MAG: hypothetical protein LUH15_08915 [Tannerellaceae bacterium]|nr:hypothetical protein [Tannerellaceae bacterium]